MTGSVFSFHCSLRAGSSSHPSLEPCTKAWQAVGTWVPGTELYRGYCEVQLCEGKRADLVMGGPQARKARQLWLSCGRECQAVLCKHKCGLLESFHGEGMTAHLQEQLRCP